MEQDAPSLRPLQPIWQEAIALQKLSTMQKNISQKQLLQVAVLNLVREMALFTIFTIYGISSRMRPFTLLNEEKYEIIESFVATGCANLSRDHYATFEQ